MRMQWAGAAGLLMLVAQGAAAQEMAGGMGDGQGMYTITSVNKKLVPAQTWKRTASDTTCSTVTQHGTLMLDSKGKWALLITERDRCTRGSKTWIEPDQSTISGGTYSNESGILTLTDAETGTAHRATLDNNRLTVMVTGTDPVAGQSAVYVFRRQQSIRRKG